MQKAALILLFFVLFSCHYKKETTVTPISKVDELIESAKDLTNLKIGYSSPLLNAPFYVVLNDALKENVERYGMQFLSVDSRGDITQQITGIEDLVSKGVDALVVNPIDPKALVPVINSVAKKQIPVFIVDSFIDPGADYVSSTLAANTDNGDLLGIWVATQMKGKEVNMAIISGAQGNPVGRNKRMGFIKGFTDEQLASMGYTNFKIVSQGWGGWAIGTGMDAMEDILVAHPEINLLVAENDAMAIGALRAAQAINRDDIIIVGFDGQKEALKFIQEDKLAATALNSPTELARLTIQSVIRNFNGDEGRGVVIHTPAVLINQSNVEKFYDPNAPF